MNDIEALKAAKELGVPALVLLSYIHWFIRDQFKTRNFKGTESLVHTLRYEIETKLEKFTDQLEKSVCKMKDPSCHFHPEVHAFKNEDHARLSEMTMTTKLNEQILKHISGDRGMIMDSLSHIANKIEDIAKDIRNELEKMSERQRPKKY